MSLILYHLYFLKLLCQLYQLKHIKTLLIHLFHFRYIVIIMCIISFDIYYIYYLHFLILYQLCRLIHSNCNKWYNAHNWYNRTYYMSHSHVAMCLQPHLPSLHIAGPARSPQIDKPHPASVPGTLPAVSGRQDMRCGMVPVSPTGKGLAGNGLQSTRCTPLYFVWPSTKQLLRAKWPLRRADSLNSNVSRRAYTWTIIRIIRIKLL